MKNSFKMSLFMPPISPVRDDRTGKFVKGATLVPLRDTDLAEVYHLITANRRLADLTAEVRKAALQGDEKACRLLKQRTLPYVTPCGTFSRRRSDCLTGLSGLMVVDVDHLDSTTEAEELRQRLFNDLYLCPELVFVSPTGRGVKAFVPCRDARNVADEIHWAMNYVHCMYDTGQTAGKGVDMSGKDLARACFLCHDAGALLRKP